MYWSKDNLPVAILLSKMVCPFPTTGHCQQSLKSPSHIHDETLMGPVCAAGLVLTATAVEREFMSAAVGPWPGEICSTFLHPAALTFFLPPLQGCYLSPGAGNTTLPLRAELPIVIDSLHFGQVLVSALITACGRKKSL